MFQNFDKNYSFFDASKTFVENFIKSSINIIIEREIIKNKTKPEKYFSSEKNNVVSSWCDTTENLLFQLKFLKKYFSYTDIENVIQTAFNILNFPRK
jgi:hypothetical protein